MNTNVNPVGDLRNPVAIVRHYSPSGIPTTVVTCFNVTQILNAVESGWWADYVRIQSVLTVKEHIMIDPVHDGGMSLAQLQDIISRAHTVIVESDGADEHGELIEELSRVVGYLDACNFASGEVTFHGWVKL